MERLHLGPWEEAELARWRAADGGATHFTLVLFQLNLRRFDQETTRVTQVFTSKMLELR